MPIAISVGFKGKIWLEVFVLAGITDGPDETGQVAAIVERMRPDRVQLNTVARPAAESGAVAVPYETLERLRGIFGCPCEVIAEGGKAPETGLDSRRELDEEIDALLGRRPCTVEGIAVGLGLAPNEVIKHLQTLCATGAVRAVRSGGVVFYERGRSR